MACVNYNVNHKQSVISEDQQNVIKSNYRQLKNIPLDWIITLSETSPITSFDCHLQPVS